MDWFDGDNNYAPCFEDLIRIFLFACRIRGCAFRKGSALDQRCSFNLRSSFLRVEAKPACSAVFTLRYTIKSFKAPNNTFESFLYQERCLFWYANLKISIFPWINTLQYSPDPLKKQAISSQPSACRLLHNADFTATPQILANMHSCVHGRSSFHEPDFTFHSCFATDKRICCSNQIDLLVEHPNISFLYTFLSLPASV